MLDLSAMNDAQKEAVTHGEGPLLVLAGPGSGKTFTITQRIFYLLEELHIPPEQILVITFTKAAALSMQSRFREQSKLLYPVNFGTFHSCFYHILRQSYMLQQHKIATEAEKRAIVSHLLACNLSENLDKEMASRFLQAFSFYKNTNDELGAKNKLPMEHQEDFQQMFQAYEQERERRRMLDFDDMVYQCRKLLREDAGLRTYWQRRFSHILMDEFQDINPMQYEVVKLLAGEGGQLFAVGDDDQSIYGFRGSKPACLQQYQEEFGAKMVYLSLNYRSTPDIVQASLKVISENRQRFEKKLTSAQKSSEVSNMVSLKAFEEREEQYTYLAQKLSDFIKIWELPERTELEPKNSLPESIAVLFRTNSYMQGFAAKLNRMGIPYTMKEKMTSIYDHFIVKDIMAYLQLAEGEGGREHLLRILNKPLRYLSREALGQQNTEQQGMKNQVLRHQNLEQPDSLGIMLEGMLGYYRNAQDIAYRKERISAIERLKKDFAIIKNRPLYLKVQYILKGMGYEKYLKDNAGEDAEKWQEYQEIIEWICAEAKECENLSEWLNAKKSYEKSLKEMQEKKDNERRKDNKERKEDTQDNARIQLMTVHASKGLEFDHVWIPDCNEKVFPHGNMPDAAACEEERRIFYVAMTRAKKSLELLYLTGTKERPRLPSRFLNPLLYSSTNSSNSHLSKYSSNASATLSYSSSSSI